MILIGSPCKTGEHFINCISVDTYLQVQFSLQCVTHTPASVSLPAVFTVDGNTEIFHFLILPRDELKTTVKPPPAKTSLSHLLVCPAFPGTAS